MKKLIVPCLALMLGLSSFGGVALANDQANSTSPTISSTSPEDPGTVVVYGPPEGGH